MSSFGGSPSLGFPRQSGDPVKGLPQKSFLTIYSFIPNIPIRAYGTKAGLWPCWYRPGYEDGSPNSSLKKIEILIATFYWTYQLWIIIFWLISMVNHWFQNLKWVWGISFVPNSKNQICNQKKICCIKKECKKVFIMLLRSTVFPEIFSEETSFLWVLKWGNYSKAFRFLLRKFE